MLGRALDPGGHRRAADGQRGRSPWPRGAASRSVRSARGAGEHGGLDLVDVVIESGDDRCVPVDDLVQDRPQRRYAARGQQLRPLLQPLPGAAQLAGRALPHGDHEGRREEDADLAELDLLGGIVVTRGAQDDQLHALVVGLDLRPLVDVLGVLDGQLVQAEGVADLGQLTVPGLEQAQPDEAALRTGRPPPPAAPGLRRACGPPGSAHSQRSCPGTSLAGSQGSRPLPSMAESGESDEDRRACRRRTASPGQLARAISGRSTFRHGRRLPRFLPL